jgi:hypothetical protein
MEGFEDKDNSREDIYSKAIRAGKRTYFFDVKATKRNEYYLTITESKKRVERDGRTHFEKHKVFLYKEDFEKFSETFDEMLNYIKTNAPEIEETERDFAHTKSDFSDVKFEDLEK